MTLLRPLLAGLVVTAIVVAVPWIGAAEEAATPALSSQSPAGVTSATDEQGSKVMNDSDEQPAPPETDSSVAQTVADTGEADLSRIGPGYLLEVILMLTLVGVLTYVVLRFALPRLYGAGIVGRKGSILKLEDTIALQQNGSLHLVRIGERFLLVGASEGEISLVAELSSDEVEAARQKEELAQSQNGAGSGIEQISELVKGLVGKRRERGQSES